MKILLTGSTGFVGMAFLDAIPSSWEVLCISRKKTFPLQTLKPNIKFLLSSLQDIKTLSHEIKLFGPDVCLHLAWEGLPDYGYDACSLNFNYFQSLLDVLIKNSIRKIIVAGSCFEVGLFKGLASPTIIEGMSSNLLGSYKNLHIRLLESLANASLIDFTWARIFYLYGPNQRENSLVPSIIKGFLNNQPIYPAHPFVDELIQYYYKQILVISYHLVPLQLLTFPPYF